MAAKTTSPSFIFLSFIALEEALDSLISSYESFSSNNSNQTQITTDAVQEMSSQAEKFNQVATKSQSFFQELTSSANSKM